MSVETIIKLMVSLLPEKMQQQKWIKISLIIFTYHRERKDVWLQHRSVLILQLQWKIRKLTRSNWTELEPKTSFEHLLECWFIENILLGNSIVIFCLWHFVLCFAAETKQAKHLRRNPKKSPVRTIDGLNSPTLKYYELFQI